MSGDPRPIQNDDDLLDAQIRALIIPFLDTLTPHQRDSYHAIQVLLDRQAMQESDRRGDRSAELFDRAFEALIDHVRDPGRLVRLLYLHCFARPIDEVTDCCREGVQS